MRIMISQPMKGEQELEMNGLWLADGCAYR